MKTLYILLWVITGNPDYAPPAPRPTEITWIENAEEREALSRYVFTDFPDIKCGTMEELLRPWQLQLRVLDLGYMGPMRETR